MNSKSRLIPSFTPPFIPSLILLFIPFYSLTGGTPGKLHDKSAGHFFQFRLGIAVHGASLHHPLKPRPPAFDKADVVEYFRQPPVARDGAIVRKQTLDVQFLGKESRAPDLQAVVEDTDLDVAGISIIPVDDGIHDGLAQRLQRIIPLLVAGGFGAKVLTLIEG